MIVTFDDIVQYFLIGVAGGFTISCIFSLLGYSFYKNIKMLEGG